MPHIKTRFPPSPTGFLHIGSLRTALFAYLFAKKNGGTFVLRIEDTDRNRLVDGAVENIVDTLNWAGITVDEGVAKNDAGEIIQKGDAGPYIQSERLNIYRGFVDQLLAEGKAYIAFDTAEQLDEMRKRQQLNKQPTGYERDSMSNQFTLGEEETARRVESGDPHVVRLLVPSEGETTVQDIVRGEVTIQNKLIDDQILLKADGFPTYHLAVVVDDHHMGITHVIRGEEWLSSTPKHVLLYQAFGWELPQFAHLPLLVNEKKAKLSKRHGDVSVEDFKAKGYLKDALLNFIAFLGWNPGDEREIFTLDQLEAEFSLERVAKSAAVFNREKLAWFNKQYMMQMPLPDLAELALPHFTHAGVVRAEDMNEPHERARLEAAIAMERSRVDTLSELPQALGFVFSDQLAYEPDLLVWKKSTPEETKKRLAELHTLLSDFMGEWTVESLEQLILPWIKEQGYGNGDVLWPMRTALSGQKNSPGPFEIAAVLGKAETLARLYKAKDLL